MPEREKRETIFVPGSSEAGSLSADEVDRMKVTYQESLQEAYKEKEPQRAWALLEQMRRYNHPDLNATAAGFERQFRSKRPGFLPEVERRLEADEAVAAGESQKESAMAE